MVTREFRERYRARTAFVILATTFALLFGVVVALLAMDQHRVLEASQRLQQDTIPQIIRFQRLARNLEQIRQEGERVFSATTPEGRQQSLFLIMLVASHPSILEHPQSAEAARDAERFLIETGNLASGDRSQISQRHAEWQNISKRLSLLVDDLSVQGASLATDDLNEMVAVMQLARAKLIGALILVGGFLLLLILLLNRHLIRPLQRIDQTLSSLNVDQPAPEFPDARMAEIHAVEQATRRLHDSLAANEAARRELELLANRDGLTGLINRRHFMVIADAELQHTQGQGWPAVIALGDLDYFKRLNDTYGHAAGDTVLQAFALLLEESFRQSDLVCRYGGEEFAFLFPDSTVEQARALADRFRQRVADHDIRLPDGLLIRVTLCIGLADASKSTIESALHDADFALYEAKRLGRNRVIVAAETA